ncbi:Acg family FMN-binding oxidoreductase [Nonomuraea sp. NPDC059194]|uniref:Acg family FMN-binding oxidoreductase n=1 Tax=Nonomuraea sp. NPDC059194 TaxID=3346764 RepID=UPI0036818589
MQAEAIRAALEAATWAPSVHNTQPWTFAVAGEEIGVRADADRKLRAGDPEGREMLIGCGAALFNIRTVLRSRGRAPVTRILPDPDRANLLATVRLGEVVTPDETTRLLCAEIERRRTHRAGFTTLPVPGKLVEALVRQAAAENVKLMPIGDERAVRVLAAVTQAAQAARAEDAEVRRWGRAPGSPRKDGVPADAYPHEPSDTGFPQRDYAWGIESDQPAATATGVVAVMTTPRDSRQEWIATGQALQRVLLYACAYGVSAAFHTQSLELPHLREFLREEVCSGEYPQMIMRLGFTFEASRGVRRPLSEVLD